MPKGFTEQEKEQIQQKMLQVATQLFSTHGLKKTNVEEITRACGISKGAFYLFYPSKEALFMAILDEADQTFKREITEAFQKAAKPLDRETFKIILKNMFKLMQENPMLRLFKNEDYEYLVRKLDQKQITEHVKGDTQYFRELYDHFYKLGIFRQVNPDSLNYFSTSMYLLSLHEELQMLMSFEQLLDFFVDMFAAYLIAP